MRSSTRSRSTTMTPKVRENRLKLLNEIRAATRAVCRFFQDRGAGFVDRQDARRLRCRCGGVREGLARPAGAFAIYAEVVERVSSSAAAISADIGCGSGREVSLARTPTVFRRVGFDARKACWRKRARRLSGLRLRDMPNCPTSRGIAARAYDNVLCETVIMHHRARADRGRGPPPASTSSSPCGVLCSELARVTAERRSCATPVARLYAAFDCFAGAGGAEGGTTLLLDRRGRQRVVEPRRFTASLVKKPGLEIRD